MKFHVLADAHEDLEEIFLYWAERAGVAVADRIIDSITERFGLLGQFPKAGKAVSSLVKGVRCLAAGDYLIYYLTSKSVVQIIHIFHGARNQSNAFHTPKRRH